VELVAAPVAVQDSLGQEAERRHIHPALAKATKLVGMVIQCLPAGLRAPKRDGTDTTYRPVCTVVCSSLGNMRENGVRTLAACSYPEETP
jgi:hypothetical protein